MVHQAAERNDDAPLSIKATLRLVDEEGIPSDYLSGDNLTNAMMEVYEDLVGGIHKERMQLFKTIDDWTLRAELIDQMTHTLVDPIFHCLLRPEARLLHLCYQAVQMSGIIIPKHLWWTPYVAEQLRAHNPDSGTQGIGSILAMVNHGSYHCITNNIKRSNLPLREYVESFYRSVFRVHRAGLLGLLDNPAELSVPPWVSSERQ